MDSKKFTYPFRYVPSPEVVAASKALIERIKADEKLDSIFSEGKMLGVLVCEETTLYAFSGLAGGKSLVEGFVPPVFDWAAPDGYFRKREADIVRIHEDDPSDPRAGQMSKELQDWLFE